MKRVGLWCAWLCVSTLGACSRHEAGAGASKRVGAEPSASSTAPVSGASSHSGSAALAAPSAAARCITPDALGLQPLATLHGATHIEDAAVAAARRELARVLEDPTVYLASVQTAADLVLLELWHPSAFLPENCRDPQQLCRKCRTMAYDAKRGRVTSTKVWHDVALDP